jgi:predicted ArsR family transcriptional regulator
MKQGVQNVLYEDKIYRIMFVRCENSEIFKENKMTETKQTRVLMALQSGEQLTAKQISARFGIANPTATISNIRFAGYAVYANESKDTKGRVTTKYRLGTPSRELVAAGYRAMSLGIV